MEGCGVVQEGKYGDDTEHKHWAKLAAVDKWIRVYDRVLVADPG